MNPMPSSGPHEVETLGGRGLTSCVPSMCLMCLHDRIEQLETALMIAEGDARSLAAYMVSDRFEMEDPYRPLPVMVGSEIDKIVTKYETTEEQRATAREYRNLL